MDSIKTDKNDKTHEIDRPIDLARLTETVSGMDMSLRARARARGRRRTEEDERGREGDISSGSQ